MNLGLISSANISYNVFILTVVFMIKEEITFLFFFFQKYITPNANYRSEIVMKTSFQFNIFVIDFVYYGGNPPYIIF